MPVLTRTFDLWGGRATVGVDGDEAALDAAVAAVQEWLAVVDLAASHYREDSELAELHRADGRPTRVGPVLAEALEVALEAARRTDGVVDPTVGTVTLSPPAAIPLVTRAGSWRDVVLSDVDDSGATVTLPPGVRLDLGATAKAWAADRAAGLAFLATGTGVLVSLAGDLSVAGRAPEGGWLVLVTDDHRETADDAGDAAETVSITAGGLATSSTTVRRRTAPDGSSVSHVVDPVNWRPVTPVWRTVSVAAPDCVTANTATTAAIVLGDRAEQWLVTTGLPTRLVSTDGRLVRLGAWPEPHAEQHHSEGAPS